MSFENTPMKWDKEGAAPSSNLSSEGYKAGSYPAADTFNYFFNNNNKCITELQAEVETTQNDVETVQSDVETVQSNVETVQSNVTTQSNEITELQKNTTTMSGDITTLQSDVETIQSDVATVQSDVETVQSDVAEIQKTHNVVNRYSLTLTDDFKSATTDRSNYVIEINGIATLYMRFTMTNAGTLSGNWTIATLPSGMHPAKGGGTALNYANNFIQGTGCVSGLTIEGTENDEGTHNVVIWPWGSNDRTYEANEVFLLYIQFPVEYDKE